MISVILAVAAGFIAVVGAFVITIALAYRSREVWR